MNKNKIVRYEYRYRVFRLIGNPSEFVFFFENAQFFITLLSAIMFILVGVPMVFLETSLGQFSSRGPVKIWSFCPVFRGTGLAQVLLMFYVGIYYNVIISYAIFFLFASFDSNLPWNDCTNWWNTQNCRSGSAQRSGYNHTVQKKVVSFNMVKIWPPKWCFVRRASYHLYMKKVECSEITKFLCFKMILSSSFETIIYGVKFCTQVMPLFKKTALHSAIIIRDVMFSV